MPPWFGGRPFDGGPAAAMEKLEIAAAEGDTESKEISENVDVHGGAAKQAAGRSDKIVESVEHSDFMKEIAVAWAQTFFIDPPKSPQDFLLPLSSEESPGSEGSPETAQVQSASGLGTDKNQMEPPVETQSHWKRDVRMAPAEKPAPSTPPRRLRELPRTSRKAPVKPGLVTPESCMECLYPKPPKDRHYHEGAEMDKEAVRKQKVKAQKSDKVPEESHAQDAQHVDATEEEKDLELSKQKVSPHHKICEEPHAEDKQDKQYVEVTVEKDATPTTAAVSPAKCGKMTLRVAITPQHFFSYGTAFRDVQVDFKPARVIVRAIDMEGYSWSGFAQDFPGPLAVDQCTFKIDPEGKKVQIKLRAAEKNWDSFRNFQLERFYNLNKEKVEDFMFTD